MAYPSDLVRTKNWGTETLTDTDLEAQYDLIINWVMAMANETTGHKHDATENEGPKIILTSAVTGTLPLGNGGTGQTTLAGLLGLVYPVGCIYFNITDVNPATELGFGTWSAYGAGRVPVGKDSGDTDFDADEETGGSKTHTLTEAEIPSHNHSISLNASGGSSNTSAEGGSGESGPQTSGSKGGGGSHNNLQPYIVVSMWKRTA